MNNKATQVKIGAGVLIVLVLLGGYLLLLSPKLKQASMLSDQATAANTQATTLASQAKELKTLATTLPDEQKAFDQLAARLSARPKAAEFATTVQKLQQSTGVQIMGFTLESPVPDPLFTNQATQAGLFGALASPTSTVAGGAPAAITAAGPVTAPGATPGASAAPGTKLPAVAGQGGVANLKAAAGKLGTAQDGVYYSNVTFTVTGGYPQFINLIRSLEHLDQAAFLVSDVSLTFDGSPQVKGSVRGRFFLIGPKQAAPSAALRAAAAPPAK